MMGGGGKGPGSGRESRAMRGASNVDAEADAGAAAARRRAGQRDDLCAQNGADVVEQQIHGTKVRAPGAGREDVAAD